MPAGMLGRITTRLLVNGTSCKDSSHNLELVTDTSTYGFTVTVWMAEEGLALATREVNHELCTEVVLNAVTRSIEPNQPA